MVWLAVRPHADLLGILGAHMWKIGTHFIFQMCVGETIVSSVRYINIHDVCICIIHVSLCIYIIYTNRILYTCIKICII